MVPSILMNRNIDSQGEFLLRLHVERLPEGKYLATTDALPDLLAQGDTLEEAIEIARDVARKLLESYPEHGDPIPSSLRPASDSLEVDTAFAL
jgi:antitoxin HicB